MAHRLAETLVRFFIHLAADSFGAEALGRLVRALGGVAVLAEERHIFVWCGPGAAPSEDDYWAHRFPRWDDSVVLPLEGYGDPKSLDFDRGAAASSVSKFVQSTEGRKAVTRLTAGWPGRLFGAQTEFSPVVILTGSLVNPVTSAVALGLVDSFAALRKVGEFDVPVYVVAATGFASGPFENYPEKARGVAARALLDLEVFLQGGDSRQRAAAVFLVGEEPISGAAPGRAEGVALAALTAFGITRSAARMPQPPVGEVDPFAVYRDAAGEFQIAGEPFEPARPFSAVGAYAVHCPAEALARLFATRIASACFAELSKQKPWASLEEASKVKPEAALASFLRSVEAEAIADLWDKVHERTSIPWREEAPRVQEAGWFELDRVRMLFGAVFEQQDWKSVADVYGEERIRALPFDSWECALDELTELIENGVIPRRSQHIELLSRRIAAAFLESVESGVSRIFRGTFQEPVGAEPHLAAQCFLGGIRRRLLDAAIELDSIAAIERGMPKDTDEARKRVNGAREALRKEMAAVPSPAAVLLRLAPVFGVCVGLAIALPFDLGILNSPPARLVLGVAAGAIGMSVLFYRYVQSVRRRLLQSVHDWLKYYRIALREEDEKRKQEAYTGLLVTMRECLEWLFDGQKPDPPLPQPVHVILEPTELAELHQYPDELRPQTVFSEFQGYLGQAASSFEQVGRRLLDMFQNSRLETALPEISVSQPDAVDAQLERFLLSDAAGKTLRPEAVVGLMMYELHANEGSQSWLVPFDCMNTEDAAHIWRRSFCLPAGRDLLDASVRESSSAFLFLETLRNYIFPRLTGALDLSTRLADYLADSGCQNMAQTPLWHRYQSLASPSLPGNGVQEALVAACGPADHLAVELGWQNDLGRGRISAHLEVRGRLSASAVIFYPNEASPSTPLGLAWKACLVEKWAEKAYEPVKMGSRPSPGEVQA